ncbi:PREDICTED: condensin complex subunit 2-like [Polistes dominula]|uniref:Condensin complex subunit 2 n=1 Tax=Polistes dominula TaxID=743375 RepID=A0ABM1JA98_POLDO|nr:PREDICTED: condensin complex subunit 2-like [Polistes dominula]
MKKYLKKKKSSMLSKLANQRLSSFVRFTKWCTSSTPNNKYNERKQSLGLSSLAQMPETKMTELISEYIKLSTENKINPKNAFSLKMIDYMTYMVTKRYSEMTNLQMASTSLDVCAKIYGYRIDGMYTDVLKMVGALDKQKEDNSTDMEIAQSNNDSDGEEEEVKSQTKKKKKKGKQKIISTDDALSGTIETMVLSRMTVGKGDFCSSDMLYQIVFPHLANSGFYHNIYNDIILDQLNETNENNENCRTYTISKIDDIFQSDLFPSMSDFQFLRWSLEDEEEIIEPVQKNNENQQFHFDLDASIPSADEEYFEEANYFQMDTDTNDKNMCATNPKQTENIVDFRKIMTEQIMQNEEMPEYSLLNKNMNLIHRAGPSYWKHKGLKTLLSNSKVVETCQHTARKKRKEFELSYTNENKSKLDQKFECSKVNRIQLRTVRNNWMEEKITLPEDLHYDITNFTKLYLCPSISSYPNSEGPLNSTQLPEDIENYNYNNDNDVSNFCPGIDVDCDTQDKNDSDENPIENPIPFTNDNLVTAPTLINKIIARYPSRAKKIDMHQLKKTIWKAVSEKKTDTDNKEETQENDQISGSINFSDIYKTLPTELPKSNAEALSVPIAIVSML